MRVVEADEVKGDMTLEMGQTGYVLKVQKGLVDDLAMAVLRRVLDRL